MRHGPRFCPPANRVATRRGPPVRSVLRRQRGASDCLRRCNTRRRTHRLRRAGSMAFAGLELGRDEKEFEQGGLSLKKNPLVVSIIDGCTTLKNLLEKKQLTSELVAGAKGLMLLRTDKIGFGISVTQGYGLVVVRLANTPSGWSAPLPLKVDGFSMGAVMGYSEQHTCMLLTTDQDIENFYKDKRALKIGMDLGLSVGKKLNENRTLDPTNIKKEQEQQSRSFTISKGYIVDVSLKGTSVEPDVDDMESAYGAGTTPADVLQGRVKPPVQAQLLYNALRQLEGKAVGAAGAGAAI